MSKTLSLSEIDPKNNLFLTQRAVIAALTDTRLRNATFADIAEMNLGDDAPGEVAELAAFRREIQIVRWLIEPGTCPEAAEFLAGFEDQFNHWRDSVLPDFGFTQKGGKPHEGHKALSDFDRLHTACTPHELLAMKAMAQKPRLALEPNHGDPQCNFAAIMLVIDRVRHAQFVDDRYGSVVLSMLDGKPITGYFPHIIDGARKMGLYAGDDVWNLIPYRLAAHVDRRNKAGLIGMNRQKYAAGIAESMLRGELIDSDLCSILDGDPLLSPYQIPYACSDSARSFFRVGGDGSMPGSNRCRFRVAAGGRRAI